ncbi:MAG: GtrA family protein [bacterium]
MMDLLKKFLSHDAHPILQFIKYGMAGGLATFVDIVVTFFFSWKVFPALTSDDKLVTLFHLTITPVAESARAQHYFIACLIAFMFSNLTAYIANVLWVFKPGRHSRHKELILFYVVSSISFIIGTGMASALIQFFGLMTSYAKIANIFASVMINYAGRKFWIFKG